MSRLVGEIGEDLFCRKLKQEGYYIVCRNYRTRYGEIDIIALKDAVLYVFEVKTSCAPCVRSLYNANQLKLIKIHKTFGIWLHEMGNILNLVNSYAFEVVSVSLFNGISISRYII